MTAFVLDASALLAVFLDEPGQNRVTDVLNRASISSVNLSEVGSRISDRGLDLDKLFAKLRQLPLQVVAFDRAQSEAAARLRRPTRSAGLSLGDRACLALAQSLNATVLTSDRAWANLPLDVEIELIR